MDFSFLRTSFDHNNVYSTFSTNNNIKWILVDLPDL